MHIASGYVFYSRNRSEIMFIDVSKLEKILKEDYKSWEIGRAHV